MSQIRFTSFGQSRIGMERGGHNGHARPDDHYNDREVVAGFLFTNVMYDTQKLLLNVERYLCTLHAPLFRYLCCPCR